MMLYRFDGTTFQPPTTEWKPATPSDAIELFGVDAMLAAIAEHTTTAQLSTVDHPAGCINRHHRGWIRFSHCTLPHLHNPTQPT